MQIYVHHVFGPGDFLVGEGAEHHGSLNHTALKAPYYTTIPADKFNDKNTRYEVLQGSIACLALGPWQAQLSVFTHLAVQLPHCDITSACSCLLCL